MTGCSNGVKAGEESCRNGMAGTAAPMSAAVMTACTPGRARAAAVSIERMWPCATELRRITACRRFSRARSSTNWPRPRSRRKSSTRSIALPMKALVVRFWSMSDDDCRLFVEQRARDAEGRQGGGFGIRARRLALELDRKTSDRALGLDFVDIAWRVGIGDELHLGGVESQSGQRHRGGDVGVLRIEQRGFPGRAGIEHGSLAELAEIDQALRRRPPPGPQLRRRGWACARAAHRALRRCRPRRASPAPRRRG